MSVLTFSHTWKKIENRCCLTDDLHPYCRITALNKYFLQSFSKTLASADGYLITMSLALNYSQNVKRRSINCNSNTDFDLRMQRSSPRRIGNCTGQCVASAYCIKTNAILETIAYVPYEYKVAFLYMIFITFIFL